MDEQQHIVNEHSVPVAKWLWSAVSAAFVTTVAWLTQVLRIRGHSKAINKLIVKVDKMDVRQQSLEAGMLVNSAQHEHIIEGLERVERAVEREYEAS